MASRGKAGMGGGSGSKKPSGRKPDEIHIRKGKSGGFIAKHHFNHKMGQEPQEPEDHVLQDLDQLHQHMDDNMGDQPPAGTPMESQAAPAQAAAPMAGE